MTTGGTLWFLCRVHWSLEPKKALLLSLLWAALAVLLALIASPFPLIQLEVGALGGIFVGALQRRSFQEGADLYLSATKGAQVRRALASTRSGRRSVGLQWVVALGLLGVAMLSLRSAAGRPRNPAFGLISGYLLLMAVRDLTSIPGLLALRRRGAAGLR